MTDILKQGLDESVVERDGPQPQVGYEEVRSFDGRIYLVGIEAAGVLSVASTLSEPQEIDLSYNQIVVARFAIDHIGIPFRGSEVRDAGDNSLTKEQFNSAVFDKSTGLWSFFNDVAGYNNLWFRDRNLHQLGDESDDSIPEEDSTEEPRPYSIAVNLKPEQEELITSSRGIIPEGGIREDELLERLSELHPEYSIPQLKEVLHSAIHRIRNNLGESSFGFKDVGRGAKGSRFITMDPDLSTAPKVSHVNPTPIDMVDGTKGKPRTAPLNAPTVRDIRGKAIGSNALRRKNRTEYDPVKSREGNMPVNWKIDRESFIVEGEVVEVHPDILRLVDCIGQCGDTWIRLADLAVIFDGGRMSEVKFKKFVVWANIALDTINSVAPVVVVENFYRKTRRDKSTLYKFNFKGDWDSITKRTPGESVIPYKINS